MHHQIIYLLLQIHPAISRIYFLVLTQINFLRKLDDGPGRSKLIDSLLDDFLSLIFGSEVVAGADDSRPVGVDGCLDLLRTEDTFLIQQLCFFKHSPCLAA